MSLPDLGTFPLLAKDYRVPMSGLTMRHSPLHTKDLLVVGENEMVGSLCGVCLKSECGRPCGDVSNHTCKISCPVGHPPEFIARIAQQQHNYHADK